MFTYQFSNDYTLTLTDDGEVDSNLSSGGFVLDSDYFSGRHTHEALVEAVRIIRDRGRELNDQRGMLDAIDKAAADLGATDPAGLIGELMDRVASRDVDITSRDQSIRSLQTTITQQREDLGALRNALDQHETWKDKLVDDAHAYANKQSWCSEFDDFMEDHGLPRRNTDYEVEVMVSYRTTLTITAANEDDARDEASSQLNSNSYFPSNIEIGSNYIGLREHEHEILDVTEA